MWSHVTDSVVRFRSKLGQISTKWDKSGTICCDQFSAQFGWKLILKSPKNNSMFFQVDPLSAQIWHSRAWVWRQSSWVWRQSSWVWRQVTRRGRRQRSGASSSVCSPGCRAQGNSGYMWRHYDSRYRSVDPCTPAGRPGFSVEQHRVGLKSATNVYLSTIMKFGASLCVCPYQA